MSFAAVHRAAMTYNLAREERKEQVVASMAAKQKKRADNIATRHERRNEKKKGGSGKSRPGFEGKSFSKGKGKTSGRKK